MATVTVKTAAFTEAALDEGVVDGAFDLSGHLILTTRGGTDIDAGSPSFSVPDASTTVKGIVELATTAETSAGTDAVRAVTPAGLAGAISDVVPDASTTVEGKVELATNTEAVTGTDTVRAVTPAGLNAALVAYIAATVLNDLSDVVISSPAAGHTLQHNGTNWVNGVMTTQESEQVATATLTSTSYTSSLTSGTSPGLTFKAPPSGKVLIHWSSYLTHTVANGFTYMSFDLKTGTSIGSGTSVVAASDTNAITNRPSGAGSVDDAQFGSTKLITGLTPGNDYNVIGMFKIITAGTGTTLNRRIIVQPVM